MTMLAKKSYVTVTDQFCGAGGSSLGAVAGGAEVVLAMNPEEQWRIIPDAADYQVSDHGRVRRHLHYARDGRPYHLLSPETIKGGYKRVSLLAMNNGRFRRDHYLIHVLVARAFLGPCPEGHEVNHKDLCPANNVLSNLEYVTPAQNVRHSFARGSRVLARGSRHGKARLDEQRVERLLALWSEGNHTKQQLAMEFGVSATTVGRIIAGKVWAHVGGSAQ